MRRVGLLALVLCGCTWIDDFSTFRAQSGQDAGVTDGATRDLGNQPPVDASMDTGDRPLTRAAFTAALADALCTRGRRCEGKLRIDATPTPSRLRTIEEESVVRLFCNPSSRAFAIPRFLPFDRPNVAFNPVAARACLDALVGQRDCVLGGLTGEPACEALFLGTAEIGARCGIDAECASGRCELSTTMCGGTCASVTTGDACTSDARCGQTLRCRGGMCLPAGRMAQTCDHTDDCAPALWCDPVAGSCQPLPDVGGACRRVPTFGSASTDPCRGALVCTPTGGGSTCQVGADAGASCASTPCRPGHRCSRSNVCVALRAEGEPCDSADNCPYQFSCVNNTCRPRPPLGEPCSEVNPCIEGGCISGRCAYLPAGATCGELLGCASYCRTNTTCGPITISLDPMNPGPTCTTFQDCPREIGGRPVECVGPAGGIKNCIPCGP